MYSNIKGKVHVSNAQYSLALTHTTQKRSMILTWLNQSILHFRCVLAITNYRRHRENSFPPILSLCAFSCTDSTTTNTLN